MDELKNRYFAHGGFMGCGPAMLQDGLWREILTTIQPGVMAKVNSQEPPACTLIRMFENNPVSSAYGACMLRQRHLAQPVSDSANKPPLWKAMELDMFFSKSHLAAFKAANDDASKLQAAHELVMATCLGHGTVLALAYENVFGINAYSTVTRTDVTGYGGHLFVDWMDMFIRACKLWQAHTAGGSEAFQRACEQTAAMVRVEGSGSAADTFETKLTLSECVAAYQELFGGALFSLVLDIKSRQSNPELLRFIVQALNNLGFVVEAVGHFAFTELCGVGVQVQTVPKYRVASSTTLVAPSTPPSTTHVVDVDEQLAGAPNMLVLPPPKELLFHHFAGDLQSACEKGILPAPAEPCEARFVLFNAGSLVTYKAHRQPKETQASYAIDTDAVEALRLYKRDHKLCIGLYVQENDFDAVAARLVFELVNREQTLFQLGLAYGNTGLPTPDLQPGSKSAHVGQYTQRLIAKSWSTKQANKTYPELAGREPADASAMGSWTTMWA